MRNKVHFIGIGGIGCSALARYYLAKGWEVSGSDLAPSEITTNLEAEGVRIFSGHRPANVAPETKLVIYSAAVKNDNDELREAKFLKIPCRSYAQSLGDLTKQYLTVAVAGAHGKSTTTALLSLMLIKAGLDPTVIIGTRLREFKGSNFRLGQSRYLVIEADEWNNSFHHYSPAIAVVTNVDKEHLDTFGDLNGVIKSFNQYLRSLPKGATAVVNKNNSHTEKIIRGLRCRISMFGGLTPKHWPLRIPGQFNQLNAEAAWQAARILGVPKGVAVKAVASYQGSWRRLERLELPGLVSKKEKLRGIFYSDYAHHPTEIRATVAALKEKHPRQKLLVVFQPHQRQRLTYLFNDFTRCFAGADQVALLPVYDVAGREAAGGKTSQELAREIARGQPAIYLKDFSDAFKMIKGQTVVFMGAGDIDKEVRKYFRSRLI